MAGYSGYSMSNNAVAAYDGGLVPASKIKGVPAAMVTKFCRAAEWHHASKAFNRVNFYDPATVRALFGLEINEDVAANPEAVAALAGAKTKAGPVVRTGCTVEWIEWTGSLSRPRANERRETGCTVSVAGATATVTLPDGSILTKRLATNGFRFVGATQ